MDVSQRSAAAATNAGRCVLRLHRARVVAAPCPAVLALAMRWPLQRARRLVRRSAAPLFDGHEDARRVAAEYPPGFSNSASRTARPAALDVREVADPRTAHSAIRQQSRTSVSSAMSSSGSIATCSSAVLSSLLTNQYIELCSTDSGYQFTAASVPTQDVIDLMCASSACRSLLADANAMDLTECILPVGDNIRLLADLIDYVPSRCPSASGSAAAGSTTVAASSTATDSTVTAGSTAGNNTASSSDTITVPASSATSTAASTSGETSATTPAAESSAAAAASAASASSGSSAASPVGRAVGVLTLGAMAVVAALM
ncbi:unnamed protein product [Phytophthora lilii]|uniref:Unnamed protein product n=1 Tax=Phytophthora lilii TaxID=2077276 RepID=A0A9W6TD12_9STRA|nr:unnamed protein product [Phytophthora lilii]